MDHLRPSLTHARTHTRTHTRSGRRERAAVECNASPRRRRQDGQTKRSSGDGPQQSVLRTLDVLETGALAAASVAGAKVLMDSRGGAGGSAQSQATTSATSGAASTTLSALVLVSLILRKATARLTEMKRESSPTSQAMMRLQNAELAVEQQGRAVEAVMKEVEGVRTRSRLVGREVKEVRKGLEEVGGRTSEMASVVGARLDMVDGQLGEVDGLIGSVHSVMAKQLGLIDGVVQRVVRLERAAAKDTVEEEAVGVRGGERGERGREGKAEARGSEQGQKENKKQIENQKEKGAAKVDAWGRSEVREPKQAVAVEKDGAVVYSFDGPS